MVKITATTATPYSRPELTPVEDVDVIVVALPGQPSPGEWFPGEANGKAGSLCHQY
jgi:hypothetical protein